WVAGSPWNRWPDAHGMGGQMTVESAIQALSELAETVEETNPHLETLVLGTAVMPNEPARVMFLGETFSSLMR
ncbi:hypothetical protein, partial [Pseudomonas aeruginosa]|uniref:hypothetical protein n=1 Tax=Pseudomonas aeruginosa TaxID=287 RepID=UPI001F2A7BCF